MLHFVGVSTVGGLRRTEALYYCDARLSKTLDWDLNNFWRDFEDRLSAVTGVANAKINNAAMPLRPRFENTLIQKNLPAC